MPGAHRTSSNTCGRCTQPTTLYLCHTCLLAFRIQLDDVAGTIPHHHKPENLPSLIDELDTTHARQDRFTTNPPTKTTPSSETLPYREHVTEALWILHNVLTTRLTDLGGPTTGTTRELAVWLLTNLNRLPLHPRAGLVVDELTDAIRHARHTIDRSHDRRVFLGQCSEPHPDGTVCLTELFGMPWEHHAVCGGCGTEHVITERQHQLRDRADTYTGTATEISRFLRATGMTVTPEMIRSYAHRGDITKTGENHRGWPVYWVHDVLHALATLTTRNKKHATDPE